MMGTVMSGAGGTVDVNVAVRSHLRRGALVPIVVGEVLIVGAVLPALALIILDLAAELGLRRGQRERGGDCECQTGRECEAMHVGLLPLGQFIRTLRYAPGHNRSK